MPNTVYPNNQELFIDPYNGKIFDFNNYQSRVYLGRSINQLLKSFGDNCIIDGLIVDPVEYDNDTKLLKVYISSGKLIIDTTLIEFKDSILLEYDCRNLDLYSGYFVVSVSFNYLHNVYDNFAKIKLLFINNNNTTNEFFIEQDKIILTKININLDDPDNLNGKLISYVKSNYFNDQHVTINNFEYKVYPTNNINKSVMKSIRELFF